MDIFFGRQEGIALARVDLALADALQLCVASVRVAFDKCKHVLALLSSVEANDAPGQVIMHGRAGTGRDDQGEEAQAAISGTEEEVLADAAPHATCHIGLREGVGEPAFLTEQGLECWKEARDALCGIRLLRNDLARFGDELTHGEGIDKPLIVRMGCEPGHSMLLSDACALGNSVCAIRVGLRHGIHRTGIPASAMERRSLNKGAGPSMTAPGTGREGVVFLRSGLRTSASLVYVQLVRFYCTYTLRWCQVLAAPLSGVLCGVDTEIEVT